MQQVLILGAAEFIGRRVVSAISESGWARPIAGVSGAPLSDQPDVRHVRVDATDAAGVSAAMRGVDAVVNCVVGSPATIAASARVLFSEASRANTKPLIVHLSSMSVYGTATGDVTEESPLRADLGPYCRAKLQAESYASGYARTVILRPGCEYGGGCELWSGRIARWLYARRVGDMGAGGDGYCNLLHIDDLVAAILSSVQRSESVGKAFNLAMDDPPTWNEYFVRFARALGAVPVKRIPARQLAFETKVLAAPLKALEIAAHAAGLGALSPAPPIPPSLLGLMRQEIKLNCTRAQRILGWTSRPLDDGLRESAAWFGRPTGHDRSCLEAGRNSSGAASR